MEKTYTPEQIKDELDKIKNTIIISSNKLEDAAQRVLKSSVIDLSENLLLLKKAILEYNNDLQNYDLNS